MTKIEWTHRPGTKPEVLNPVTGCDKISPGCRGCYAEVMHKRLTGMGQPKYQQPFLGNVSYWPDELARPFSWRDPRTIFINSMADIFHDDVPVIAIAEIYAMMFLTPRHTHIVLTKRAERAFRVLTSHEFFLEYCRAVNRLHDKYISRLSEALYFEDELETLWPLPNVEQGVSVENQEYGDDRVYWLIRTPAITRFISYEPALGPFDICQSIRVFQFKENHSFYTTYFGDKIHWVICGGESGHNARPMHPDWARSLRDQCKAAGVPFFFKQWGEWGFNDQLHHADIETVKIFYDAEQHEFADGTIVHRVRKSKSGNFLDGVQHLEFPLTYKPIPV